MSTSGSAQLENDSQKTILPHLNGMHDHCHYSDACKMTCRVSKEYDSDVVYGHNHRLVSFSLTFMIIIHILFSQSSGNKNTDDNGSLVTESIQSNSSGDLPRRYCPCCYCELFGNNGVCPITILSAFLMQY